MKRFRRARVEAPARHAVLVPDPDQLPERRHRLGELLVQARLVTAEDVEAAMSADMQGRLGERLLKRGLVDEKALTQALGHQLQIPVVDLRDVVPNPDATALVAETDAHLLDVLPIAVHDAIVDVVVADPLNHHVVSFLRSLPAEQVRITLGEPTHLRLAINRTYRALSQVGTDIEAFREIETSTDAQVAVETIEVDEHAPIVQVVNKIVTQALRDRASDVHIEPGEDQVRVRYRIDGALKEVVTLPSAMGPALVSRIKIMAEMNIVERRRPQDGQFEMTIDGRELDVRVSTTTTIWGEKAVLRLLDRTRSLYSLSDLGMPDEVEAEYFRIARSPFGMVIVSGPTGSGKTTTLYATLSEINRPDINVMTIEDPVEYVFPSINQIQISEQAGLSFATGLKSILRQDPDVILVGEVRDVETARIAVQSALTGHLVLSSLHAIDSVSALYRLVDMGVESFLVTSAIVGVVAQRLVRRICTSCAAPYEPTLEEAAIYRKLGGAEKTRWMRGTGCSFCSDTGYFDRVGVYEVLAITDELRQCLVNGVPPRQARDLAVQRGLRTLQAEAIRLVERDVTTIDEVVRNVFVSEDSE